MAIVDADNRLVSATPEALAWFDELESVYRLPDPLLGRDVPSEVTIVAQEARARAARRRPRPRAPARAPRNGVWLLIHASCLHGGDGPTPTPPW